MGKIMLMKGSKLDHRFSEMTMGQYDPDKIFFKNTYYNQTVEFARITLYSPDSMTFLECEARALPDISPAVPENEASVFIRYNQDSRAAGNILNEEYGMTPYQPPFDYYLNGIKYQAYSSDSNRVIYALYLPVLAFRDNKNTKWWLYKW